MGLRQQGLNIRIPEFLVDDLKGKTSRGKSFVTQELFALINHAVLNRHRPSSDINHGNHNGTHSARQLFLIRRIREILKGAGVPEFMDKLENLSEEKWFAVELAMIFLRAGRVDESFWKDGDNYHRRGFEIFKYYAQELNIDKEIIDWLEPIMSGAVTQISQEYSGETLYREVIENPNCENALILHLFDLAHHLDLKRVPGKDTQELKKHVLEICKKLFENFQENAEILEKLSREFLEKTGSSYQSDSQEEFRCSSADGARCYERLKEADDASRR